MDNNKWVLISHNPPKNNVVVMTKIDDFNGVRNEQKLKRNNNLWFVADGSMYVYYTPTHWKPL